MPLIDAGFVALAALRHKKLLDVPLYLRMGDKWVDFADFADKDFKKWATDSLRRTNGGLLKV